jgi:hypothetical protein
MAGEVAQRPSPSMDQMRAATPQEDWWPRFVREALGKESTSQAGADNGLIPSFTYQELASG